MPLEEPYRLTTEASGTAPVVRGPGTARTNAVLHAGQQ